MSTPAPHYDTSAPVLVTGATGYVAGWLVSRLLDEGFTVHAAVREPSNAEKTGPLQKLADAKPGTLRFFKADLLEPGSYAEAMQGCGVVFHTASPFTVNVADPQRDLVDPALKGTRNVLASANAVDSVKRVVVTSSCAAIYGVIEDVAKAPGGVLTEDDWNTSSSLTVTPYNYSKTLVERAAWEMAGAQDRWKLVVINPALVLGPGINPDQTSESFNYIKAYGTGAMKDGAPPREIGMVDVKDVAEAHMLAGFVPEAEGRHITFAEAHDFLYIANVLRERFGDDWPFPTKDAPSDGPKLPWKADNSKSRRALGLTYHPVSDAIAAMFAQQVEAGAIARP